MTLQEISKRIYSICQSDVSASMQDELAAAFVEMRDKALLAQVVDLESKIADGEWLSIWIANKYKELEVKDETTK